MSLLEGMLNWNMLEGMGLSGPPTEIWLAIREDGATGSGLEADPYNCSPNSGSDNDPGLDRIMRRFATQVKITFRLHPGKYYTNGFNSAYNLTSKGWSPGDQWRIVGSGRNCTTLSAAGPQLGEGETYVIGMPANGALEVELGELSVEVALPSGHTGQYGGIDVTGANIRIFDVWVTAFGCNSSATGAAIYGISAARAAATHTPYNCVIQNCSVASPNHSSSPNPVSPYGLVLWGTTAGVQAIGLSIRSTAANHFHTACAIRDCYVNAGINSTGMIGMTGGGGNYSRVEGNRTVFCSQGGPTIAASNGEAATGDLRGFCNYSANVPLWIGASASLSSTVFFCELHDNLIDLNGTAVQAVSFGSGSNISFTSVLLSDNISRRFGTPNTGDKGFEISVATNLWIADCMAQVPTDSNGRYTAGVIDGATHPTFSDNRTPTLELLRGYNPPPSGLLAEELITKAQDMCLGI